MSKLQQLAEQKDSIQISGQGFLCDFEDLYVEDGFNVRDIDKNHLVKMRGSWINGATFPPLQVEVKEDGRLKVIDGHHRYYSYKWATATGGLEKKPLPIVEFVGSTAEQIALMITSSEGKPLSVLERAGAYYRMHVENCSNSEIAKAVNESDSHVDKAIKMYTFVAEHEAYEPLVEAGIISTNKINMFIKNYGENAEKVLSREIDIKSLDLEPIQSKPSAVNLTDEQFEAKLKEYNDAVKAIKAQIAKNSASVTYKKPAKSVYESTAESILDIGVSIQKSINEGKTKGHSVTVTLDAALAQQILAAKMLLKDIETHNMGVKKSREELGLDLYDDPNETPAFTKGKGVSNTVDTDAVEEQADSDVDVDGDLSDPTLGYDDMNIDPIPNDEDESQVYGS